MLKLKDIISEIKNLPKRSLEYWIKLANSRKENNENVELEALVEAKVVFEKKYVEGITVSGYELYRIWTIKDKKNNKNYQIVKPSLGNYSPYLPISFGLVEDSEEIKKENIKLANLRLARDIKRLEGAGIKVEIKNKFDYNQLKEKKK